MSYGLELYDELGRLKFSSDYLVCRHIATYIISSPPYGISNYTINHAGIIDDGSWYVNINSLYGTPCYAYKVLIYPGYFTVTIDTIDHPQSGNYISGTTYVAVGRY